MMKYKRKLQQCPECGHPYLQDKQYEWICPSCGLVVWEVTQYMNVLTNSRKTAEQTENDWKIDFV